MFEGTTKDTSKKMYLMIAFAIDGHKYKHSITEELEYKTNRIISKTGGVYWRKFCRVPWFATHVFRDSAIIKLWK